MTRKRLFLHIVYNGLQLADLSMQLCGSEYVRDKRLDPGMWSNNYAGGGAIFHEMMLRQGVKHICETCGTFDGIA